MQPRLRALPDRRRRHALNSEPDLLPAAAGELGAHDDGREAGVSERRHPDAVEALADADLVLLVLDASASAEQEELELLATLAQRPALVAVNKCDLAHPSAAMQQALSELKLPVVQTSALGMDQRKGMIVSALQNIFSPRPDSSGLRWRSRADSIVSRLPR